MRQVFDRYSREYVPYEKSVNITEKRAPTDDSIKLYGELQNKAFESIVDTFELTNNVVDGVAVATMKEFSFRNVIFLTKFKLNGVEYKTQTEFPRVEYSLLDKSEKRKKLIEFLIKSIGERITYQILLSVERDLAKSLKEEFQI